MASAAPQFRRCALTPRRSAVSTPLDGAVLLASWVRFHSPSGRSSACVRCDARPLYATVLAVAGNAAGHTVQRYSIPVLYSSYHLPFISFQVQVSYSLTIFTVCRPAVWCTVCAGLLSGLQLCASCSAPVCTCRTLSYCVHYLPSVSPTVCHPSSVPRSLVSAAPRSLCVSSDTISL